MLRRKPVIKLTICRETIRVLADKELGKVAGGFATDTCKEVCTTQRKAQDGGG